MDIHKFKKFFQATGEKEKSSLPDSAASLGRTSFSADAADLKRILSLSKELDLPLLNLSKYQISPEMIRLIPEKLARTYKIIPLAKLGNVITVAISDPFDIVAVDSIKDVVRLDIQLVLSTAIQISKAIEGYYSALNLEKASALFENLTAEAAKPAVMPAAETIDLKEIAELSQKEQIVEMVNNILVESLQQRASDIHLEPYPDTLRIRYRIDGILQERKPPIDKKYESAIVARLKIMSKLDITQRRLPQDGRISLRLNSREIDLRVSVIPLTTGEKVVLRILEKGALQLDLEKLGFSPHIFEIFKTAILRPHGMILITGPTGSGKSTTLYCILNRLNSPGKNLITIEDPVEYQIKGITQIPVRPEIGLSFAHILRAVLRQAPDIVMVGEIRDFETVDIAIKSALTGHLILTTLHTNDAISAIVRLMNMGVEPFLISSTIIFVAAQRLCRRICPKCKEAYEVSIDNLAHLHWNFTTPTAILYRGKGCQYCNHTGYFGRVAVTEALVMDDYLRQMVLEKQPLTRIKEYARSQNMKTLRQDAIEKCLAAEISLEEALRVTPES